MGKPTNEESPDKRWEWLMTNVSTAPRQEWYPQCKGCMFADEDITFEDGSIATGHDKDTCAMYEQGKPPGVDSGEKKCPNYEG